MALMGVHITYHGTNREVAESFISSQECIFSISNSPNDTDYYNLWLGDGFYLFEYDFYAFKWMFRKLPKYNGDRAKALFKKECSVLEVRLEIADDRIFDINNVEHRTIFDGLLTGLKKQDPPNRNLDKRLFTDGLIINILFNELGYSVNFDLVVAMFPINADNYKNYTQLRSGPLLQKQYCVKNKSIIKEMSQFDYYEYIDDYINIWKTLFPKTKPFGKVEESIYTVDRGIRYES